MKTKTLIILALSFMILTNYSCFAQDSIGKPQGQHTIYAELLGNAWGLYTIGYDYTLKLKEKHKLSLNCGVSYLDGIVFAPEISYLYGRKHHFELGVGTTYNTVDWNWNIWGVPFRIGYRYQKEDGGFFFKAAYTPILTFWYEAEEIQPLFFPIWAGVAFGYTFKNKK